MALAQRDLELIPGAGDYILKGRGQAAPDPLPTVVVPDPGSPYSPAPAYGESGAIVVDPSPVPPPATPAPVTQ